MEEARGFSYGSFLVGFAIKQSSGDGQLNEPCSESQHSDEAFPGEPDD